MAITSKGLQKLGFISGTDYQLYDEGAGVQITWKSASPQPSDSDIETAHAAWEAEAYARTRADAYPSIGDQLDMLWHAIDVGDWTAVKVKTTSFYTELKAVKDANPKP